MTYYLRFPSEQIKNNTTTSYLRFPSEQIAISCFVAAQMADENASIILCTHDYAIDVIGTITTGGEYDEEGNVITQPTTLPGWHINYAGELPSDWEQYLVTPENPVRIFFFRVDKIN